MFYLCEANVMQLLLSGEATLLHQVLLNATLSTDFCGADRTVWSRFHGNNLLHATQTDRSTKFKMAWNYLALQAWFFFFS